MLHWPPSVFWAATPRELAACFWLPTSAAGRTDLENLIATFPDEAAP